MTRPFLAVLALLLASIATAATKPSDLPDKWRVWLEDEIYPMITSEQRKAFLALETEAQREEFSGRLWRVWAVGSGLPTEAFRRNYEDRLQTARAEFGNTKEDRARVMLLHGEPDARRVIDCDQTFYPLEFWRYARLEGLGENIILLFYKPYGLGKHRLWDPVETRLVLYSPTGQMALKQQAVSRFDRPEYRCGDGDEILRLLGMAEFWLKDIKVREAMDHRVDVATTAGESASDRFLEFSTLLDEGAEGLAFEVRADPGSRKGGKIRVAFSSLVERAGLASSKVGTMDVVQIDVTGEVSRAGEMADRFRYAFTFPSESKELPVLVERELRPGTYTLRLKIADSNSKKAGVKEIEFEVAEPVLSPATAAEQEGEQTVERLAKSMPTLALSGPEREGVTGIQRFTAMTGPSIARVEFFLNGASVLAKNRPPFEVDLDLGPVPRLATVTAVGYDAQGNEIGRSEAAVNVGRERFMVTLQPMGEADKRDGKVHVRADVNVPPERTLKKVEIYWNEALSATLFSPPFEAWLTIEDTDAVGYVRALATLDNDNQAEDVQFLNAPLFLQGVTVEAVELPVTVLGDGGKPVEGLAESEFEVLEDGRPQELSHFSLQRNLPIRLGLVIDTSGSMEKTLSEVQRVVMGFLRNLLRPTDRADVVAFSDRPALVQGFTADFDSLERAMITLKADRETAFYDAVVYGLFQFSGMRGRKAMIVLTDGEDNASRMDFDRVMDYAQRSGVTIYTIGIDLPITKVRTRAQLTRLARATGGDSFFLSRDAKLEPVYEQINAELRTQYLLAYTSDASDAGDDFRKVEVKVKRPDVDVRTIAGYYPGG